MLQRCIQQISMRQYFTGQIEDLRLFGNYLISAFLWEIFAYKNMIWKGIHLDYKAAHNIFPYVYNLRGKSRTYDFSAFI